MKLGLYIVDDKGIQKIITESESDFFNELHDGAFLSEHDAMLFAIEALSSRLSELEKRLKASG